MKCLRTHFKLKYISVYAVSFLYRNGLLAKNKSYSFKIIMVQASFKCQTLNLLRYLYLYLNSSPYASPQGSALSIYAAICELQGTITVHLAG